MIVRIEMIGMRERKREVVFMSPEEIKKAVESFPELLEQQAKLNERLTRLGGRDPEQEMFIMQRLQPIERMIEFIDYAIFNGKILDARESTAVDYRTIGKSLDDIAKVFSLKCRQSARNILKKAYKKMSDSFTQ